MRFLSRDICDGADVHVIAGHVPPANAARRPDRRFYPCAFPARTAPQTPLISSPGPPCASPTCPRYTLLPSQPPGPQKVNTYLGDMVNALHRLHQRLKPIAPPPTLVTPALVLHPRHNIQQPRARNLKGSPAAASPPCPRGTGNLARCYRIHITGACSLGKSATMIRLRSVDVPPCAHPGDMTAKDPFRVCVAVH